VRARSAARPLHRRPGRAPRRAGDEGHRAAGRRGAPPRRAGRGADRRRGARRARTRGRVGRRRRRRPRQALSVTPGRRAHGGRRPGASPSAMFGFEISVLEIVVRGTVMYLVLFAMLRFVLKREAGELGMPDVLLVVLLA